MQWMVLTGVVLLGATAAAQPAATALPPNYKVQFENEYVRVTSVRYGPNEKLPGHAHTPTPSAYVYLNDGGPVIYRHMPNGPAATRPATKAGAFRVYRGLDEVHEVENTTATVSDFLRVEMKTQVIDAATIRGKFERPGAPAGDALTQFDHAMFAVSRVWVQPGRQQAVVTGPQPALVIALSNSGGWSAGQVRWIPANRRATLDNSSTSPIDFLRFDVKTAPVTGTR